ncbi:MAG: hypothetical protein MK085_06600 [Phycisphaerales bacterium]|nr:hypothetical protein [Phycisphaerales bacterium]
MTAGGREVSSASLHAADGDPLAQAGTRDTVLASVHAIAERTGVELLKVDIFDQRIDVQVYGSEILVLGLLAELRRNTDHWHRQRLGTPLWISPSGDD